MNDNGDQLASGQVTPIYFSLINRVSGDSHSRSLLEKMWAFWQFSFFFY